MCKRLGIGNCVGVPLDLWLVINSISSRRSPLSSFSNLTRTFTVKNSKNYYLKQNFVLKKFKKLC